MSEAGTLTSCSSEAATRSSTSPAGAAAVALLFRVRNESFSLKHLGPQQDGSNALLSLNSTLCLRALKSEDAAAKFTQSAVQNMGWLSGRPSPALQGDTALVFLFSFSSSSFLIIWIWPLKKMIFFSSAGIVRRLHKVHRAEVRQSYI